MKKYTIKITNSKRRGEEFVELMEFKRERFTNRDFKEILIPSLFSYAAQSIEYRYLTAEVLCEGKKIFTVICNTNVDGSTISSRISIARPREKFECLRVMTVAA